MTSNIIILHIGTNAFITLVTESTDNILLKPITGRLKAYTAFHAFAGET